MQLVLGGMMTNYQIAELERYNQTARNYFNKKELTMDKYEIAEMVVALREFVDYFEKKELTESEAKILMMGSEALRLAPREIHFLANEIEGD